MDNDSVDKLRVGLTISGYSDNYINKVVKGLSTKTYPIEYSTSKILKSTRKFKKEVLKEIRHLKKNNE